MKLCHVRLFALGSLVVFVTSCAQSGPRTAKTVDRNKFIQEHQLTNLPKSEIPAVMNDRVIAWMNYFQGPGRGHYQRYTERSGKYRDIMFKIFHEEGVPTDLFYLSMIESGFNVQAVSHASAVGPWQFIKGTGTRYGLAVNAWEDERRDVIKSTYAAVKYLQDLHREFGDWYLAFASYNAGEGRVRRAIKQSGTRDFWKISSSRHYLHSETRDYVPKFLAAMIIGKNLEKFGFRDIQYQNPDEYDVVNVPSQTDFSVLAKCAGTDEASIRQLNPHLVAYATPRNKTNYEIRIPQGAQKQFLVAYADVPESDRLTLIYHNVGKGETITKIAQRYGVSATALAKVNHVMIGRKLTRGRQLLIPIGSTGMARLAQIEKDEIAQGKKASGDATSHKVRRGDTLGQIAKRYRVSLAQLRSWNGLSSSNGIRIGQTIKIYRRGAPAAVESSQLASATKNTGSGKVHVLKSGETLGQVASAYSVKVVDLMQWNSIHDARKVRAGQRLVLFGTDAAAPAPEAIETAGANNESGAVVVNPTVTPNALNASVTSRASAYTVRSGDTLWSIAKNNGMRTSELVAINGLSTKSTLKVGQKLKVSGQNGQTFAANDQSLARADTDEYRKYRVQNGDSLWEIARKNGVAIDELKSWNGLGKNHQIKAGSYLKIKK